jgi:hypothetical protein
VFDRDTRTSKNLGHGAYMFCIADAGIAVPASGHVEFAQPVQPEQPVEACPVQEDQHRSQLRRIRRRRPGIVHSLRAQRIESSIANVVVAGIAALAVLLLECLQRRDDRFRFIAHGTVAPDQIGIDVGEGDRPPIQHPRRGEVEEDRAAADERLEIPVERRRIVLRERWKQLAFPASPLEEGSHGDIIGQ